MALKKIVCGASRPKTWKPLAAAIMWWEETPASHVYFYIKRDSGIHLLYQAVGSGTEFMGYHEFLAINQAVYEKEVELPDGSLSALLDYLIPRLKKRYSVKHLAGLFLKRCVLYCTGKNLPNYFADKDASEVCVEALAEMLKHQRIYTAAQDPEEMGMKEAMEMLLSIPGKELLP